MANGDVIQSSGTRRLGTVDTDSFSFSTQPTVGNTIVVVACPWNGSNDHALTASDNQSNTYDNAGQVTKAEGELRSAIVIAPITTSSGTHTVTVDFTGNIDGSWSVFEVEGIKTTSPLDKSATNSQASGGGPSTSITTGSTGTLSQADQFCVAVATINAYPDSDINVGHPAGWTARLTEDDSSTYIGGGAATLVTSATTALNPSFSFDSAQYDISACIATFELDTAVTDAVTVSDSDFNNKIFQRNTSTNDAAIEFTGTYTGTVPNDIQIKIFDDDGTTQVQDWTTGTSATISGGTWTATIDVPEGADKNSLFKTQVRSRSSAPAVLATSAVSSNIWGVGAIVLNTGHSDGSDWADYGAGSGSGTGFTPDAGMRRFTFAGAWADAGDGAIIDFCNDLGTLLDVPIAYADMAIYGSYTRDWGDSGHANYTGMTTQFTNMAAGEDGAEFAVVQLNYNDAQQLTISSKSDLKTDFLAHLSHIRAQTNASLPIFVCCSTRDEVGSNDTQFNWAKEVELEVADDQANTYYGVNGLDLALTSQHYTNASYLTFNERLLLSVEDVLDTGTYHRGPQFTSVTASGSTGTVTVTHNGGTDITVDSTHGFTASDGSGSLAISSAVRASATTITLTFGRAINGTVLVSYAAGVDPFGATEGVHDNTTEALPMDFALEVEATSPPVTSTATTGNGSQTIDASINQALSVSVTSGTGSQSIAATIGQALTISTAEVGNSSQSLEGVIGQTLDVSSTTGQGSNSFSLTVTQTLDATVTTGNGSQSFSASVEQLIASTFISGNGSQSFSGSVTVSGIDVTSTASTGNGDQTFDATISVGSLAVTSTASTGQGSQSFSGNTGQALSTTIVTEQGNQSFESSATQLLSSVATTEQGSQSIDATIVQTIDISTTTGQGNQTFDANAIVLDEVTSTMETGQGRQRMSGIVNSGESSATSDYIVTYRRRRKNE